MSDPAPSELVSKPGGEWQTCEAAIIGNKITVILNGEKGHDAVECNVATGSKIDKNVTEPARSSCKATTARCGSAICGSRKWRNNFRRAKHSGQGRA